MEISELKLVSNITWNSINKECLICNNSIGNECIKCENKSNVMGCMSIMNNNPD